MATAAQIKTVCSWCGKHLKGDPNAPATSHGICPSCYERQAGRPMTRSNPQLLVMNPAPARAGGTRVGEELWKKFHFTDADELVEVDERDVPRGTPPVLTIIGRLESLIYRVPDSSGKAGAPFEHEFSDSGRGTQCRHKKALCGCRPVLCADERGRLYIIGGNYTVEPEGIVG